jgi:hypothetical protein
VDSVIEVAASAVPAAALEAPVGSLVAALAVPVAALADPAAALADPAAASAVPEWWAPVEVEGALEEVRLEVVVLEVVPEEEDGKRMRAEWRAP